MHRCGPADANLAQLAEIFTLGERVECRDDGDDEWVSCLVTAVLPLSVIQIGTDGDSTGKVYAAEDVRAIALEQIFKVGEVVECQSNGDVVNTNDSWQVGIVTSSVPLIVVTSMRGQTRRKVRQLCSGQQKVFDCASSDHLDEDLTTLFKIGEMVECWTDVGGGKGRWEPCLVASLNPFQVDPSPKGSSWDCVRRPADSHRARRKLMHDSSESD